MHNTTVKKKQVLINVQASKVRTNEHLLLRQHNTKAPPLTLGFVISNGSSRQAFIRYVTLTSALHKFDINFAGLSSAGTEQF
jgi:hypothetical protein